MAYETSERFKYKMSAFYDLAFWSDPMTFLFDPYQWLFIFSSDLYSLQTEVSLIERVLSASWDIFIIDIVAYLNEISLLVL